MSEKIPPGLATAFLGVTEGYGLVDLRNFVDLYKSVRHLNALRTTSDVITEYFRPIVSPEPLPKLKLPHDRSPQRRRDRNLPFCLDICTI